MNAAVHIINVRIRDKAIARREFVEKFHPNHRPYEVDVLSIQSETFSAFIQRHTVLKMLPISIISSLFSAKCKPCRSETERKRNRSHEMTTAEEGTKSKRSLNIYISGVIKEKTCKTSER